MIFFVLIRASESRITLGRISKWRFRIEFGSSLTRKPQYRHDSVGGRATLLTLMFSQLPKKFVQVDHLHIQ